MVGVLVIRLCVFPAGFQLDILLPSLAWFIVFDTGISPVRVRKYALTAVAGAMHVSLPMLGSGEHKGHIWLTKIIHSL